MGIKNYTHICRKKYYAMPKIETAEIVENNGLKPADLKKAVDAVKQYKEECIKSRNEYFDED